MRFKELGELVIGDTSSLGQSVHTFSNFGIYMTVMHEGREIILVHDCFRDDSNWNAKVFISIQGSIEIEILNVGSHESGIRSRNGAIKEDFDCGKIGGFGSDIAWVVNSVTTDSEAHATWVFFLGTIGTNNTEVGGFAVRRHVFWVNEV